MVGQNNIKRVFNQVIELGAFPRFAIIIGPHGSGRKLLCKYLAKQIGAVEYVCGTSVDSVRSMINEAYKVSSKVLYVIADADKMSPQAKNALLKVAEEPPQNAYIVMTLEDINNTLGTIRSRAFVYNMDPYTSAELLECAEKFTKDGITNEIAKVISDICISPGDVEELLSTDVDAFYDYVILTLDNIATVSGSNALKIGNKLRFTESDKDKFDPKLFLRAFGAECAKRLTEAPEYYASAIQVTDKYIRDLSLQGVNKHNTFDMWVLDMRRVWNESV